MKSAIYTGTKNLYQHMIPSIKSLLINSDVEIIYLLIQDNKFPFYLPDIVQTINIKDQTYFPPNGPNMNSSFTYLAMMRAALAKLFPDIDRILSLDVDTIIDQNISDLWQLPLDNYYFAASKEPLRSTKGNKYYTCDLYTNTGVALYNLKKLREDKKVDEIINILNTKQYYFLEQDVFNIYCQGNILKMSSDYNVNEWTEPCQTQKIIHYAGIPLEKWTKEKIVEKYRNIPWEEIKR